MATLSVEFNLLGVPKANQERYALQQLNAARKVALAAAITARDWSTAGELARVMPVVWAELAPARLATSIGQQYVLGVLEPDGETMRDRTWDEMPHRKTIAGKEYCSLTQPLYPIAPINISSKTLPPNMIELADGLAGVTVLLSLPEG